MNRGFIKVWRKTVDAGWLQNHKLCAFWLWCLLKATHKEYDLIVGCQQVHLMPGDFVFGLNKASEELAMSIRSIRTIINFLKKSQNLTIKTTNKFSIISIVNWDIYQQTETTIDTQNDKLPTSYRQATDNKQECKEHKNVKNNIISDFILPEKIKKETWDAYLEMRKVIKKPATEHAKKLIIKKLLSMTDDPNLVLEQSIQNSYQGVFPLKTGGNNGNQNRTGTTPPPIITKEYVPEPYAKPSDDQIKRNIERVQELVGKLAG